jgi:hypothetical protein
LKDLDWLVILSGSLLAVVFWLFDRRCHEVLIDNYDLGELLERPERGYYADARQRGLRPKQITHTSVLGFVYRGAALVLLLAAVFTVGRKFKMSEREQLILFVGLFSLLKLVAGFSFAYLGYKLILAVKETGVMELQRVKLWTGVVSGVIGVAFIFCSFVQGVDPDSKSQIRDERVKKIAKKLVMGDKPNEEERALINSWAGTP